MKRRALSGKQKDRKRRRVKLTHIGLALFMILAVMLMSAPAQVAKRPLSAADPRPRSVDAELQIDLEHLPPSNVEPEVSLFGVTTRSGPYNPAEIRAFENSAGKKPNLLMFSQGWENDRFNPEVLARLDAMDMLPMIAWEPWNYRAVARAELKHGLQPEYKLSRIIDGSFDEYIREWAVGLKNWGKPVALRLAHEMNGNWYPWAEGVNGNRPGQYVEAWRHVRGIFDGAGADNVIWVWAANVAYSGSTPVAGLYPGDAYVDWVGLDGYSAGSKLSWGGWRSFDELYGPTMQEIRTFTDKPLVLTEVGASEFGGDKAAWIAEFFQKLDQHPDILGFIWAEIAAEADWRIVSSEAVRRAFASGAASPSYGPGLLPLPPRPPFFPR